MQPFVLGQRLSLLSETKDVRQYLTGERFWEERHAGRIDEDVEDVWLEIARKSLVRGLTAAGKFKRFAIVCAAGLGKSTNLAWLNKELAISANQQIPFLFRLDEPHPPESLEKLWTEKIPGLLRKAPGTSGLLKESIIPALARFRAKGRITLLLDSIDQASEKWLDILEELLTTSDWDQTPIVVTGRPHKIFDLWEQLIVPHEGRWRFVRIEPLETDERELLLNRDGIDRYSHLPQGGQVLMANPRNIEYVFKCPVISDKQNPDEPENGAPDKQAPEEPGNVADYTLRDLRTASHVFAGAVDHMVRYGFESPNARKLRIPKKCDIPDEADEIQIQFALDLLSAFAYSMYIRPAPSTASTDLLHRPNVSQIDREDMPDFLEEVRTRIRNAGIVEPEYAAPDLIRDLRAVAALNAEIKYDLLDSKPKRRGIFRWYDRSLQEFFAARWLARFANPTDLENLRNWRYDDARDKTAKSLYEQLWGYLVEMPKAVRREKVWPEAVGVLFEHKVTRCCEMIYRSWPAMTNSSEGRTKISEWQNEFLNLQNGTNADRRIYREIDTGFKFIKAGICQYGADPLRNIEGDSIFVHAFQMHQYAVTNEMYVRFDSAHINDRWRSGEKHPMEIKVWPRLMKWLTGGVNRCPVVNISFYAAFCFAAWCQSRLPSEEEWEHACRAGTATAWYFGNDESDLKMHAWFLETPERGTHPVGQLAKNPNRLHDMHGNVMQWCDSLYLPGASDRILRGGCWYFNGESCRSASRYWHVPEVRFDYLGFRLCRSSCVGAKPSTQEGADTA